MLDQIAHGRNTTRYELALIRWKTPLGAKILLGMVRSKEEWLDEGLSKQTIGLVPLVRFRYIIHCFSGELSQELQ